MVDVARRTSTTTATGASSTSSGVNATLTLIRADYATPARGRTDALLPTPRPGDHGLLLGVRPPDLRRLHDLCAGRNPLPRPLRPAAGQRPRDPGAAPRELRGRRRARHEDARRDQR